MARNGGHYRREAWSCVASLRVVAKVLPPRSWPRSWSAIMSRRVVPPSSTTAGPGLLLSQRSGLAAWNQLARDAGVDPHRGHPQSSQRPRHHPDPNYVAVVNNLRRAGGSVFGYVSTQYGNRDITTVIKI